MQTTLPAFGTVLLRVSVIAFAIFVTALLSHVIIDLLGDVVLAHDAYDLVPHGSRSIALAVALCAVTAAGGRFILMAVSAGPAPRATVLDVLRESAPTNRGRFTALVAALALPLLAGMEAIDIASAGGSVDDLGDLFAGSPLFACGVLLAVAAAVCIAITQVCRFLLSNADAIVAAIISFFLAPRGSRASADTISRSAAAQSEFQNILARRAGLRAPPVAL